MSQKEQNKMDYEMQRIFNRYKHRLYVDNMHSFIKDRKNDIMKFLEDNSPEVSCIEDITSIYNDLFHRTFIYDDCENFSVGVLDMFTETDWFKILVSVNRDELILSCELRTCNSDKLVGWFDDETPLPFSTLFTNITTVLEIRRRL